MHFCFRFGHLSLDRLIWNILVIRNHFFYITSVVDVKLALHFCFPSWSSKFKPFSHLESFLRYNMSCRSQTIGAFCFRFGHLICRFLIIWSHLSYMTSLVDAKRVYFYFWSGRIIWNIKVIWSHSSYKKTVVDAKQTVYSCLLNMW